MGAGPRYVRSVLRNAHVIRSVVTFYARGVSEMLHVRDVTAFIAGDCHETPLTKYVWCVIGPDVRYVVSSQICMRGLIGCARNANIRRNIPVLGVTNTRKVYCYCLVCARSVLRNAKSVIVPICQSQCGAKGVNANDVITHERGSIDTANMGCAGCV